jgi:hypothetical protein
MMLIMTAIVQIGVLADLCYFVETQTFKIMKTIKERKTSDGKKKDIRGLNS